MQTMSRPCAWTREAPGHPGVNLWPDLQLINSKGLYAGTRGLAPRDNQLAYTLRSYRQTAKVILKRL